MLMHSAKKSQHADKDYINSYTGNTFKIIILASLLISLSVIITGTVSYNSTKNALISKSKAQDMVFVVKSMSAKIDGRIQRAMETSLIIARDPANIKWLSGMEKDKKLGEDVLKNIDDIAVSYDYSSTFISSVKTQHYYFKQSKHDNKNTDDVYTLSKGNPADNWFFNVIASNKPISLNVDYDRGMNDTFLFVNALMESEGNIIGITGVGLSLYDISQEFQQFKVGKSSNLWMVDQNGIIQLTDTLKNRGKDYKELVPLTVTNEINKNLKNMKSDIQISEYTNSSGQIIDFAYHKLNNSDLKFGRAHV
jgi:hypothetical protein